jgi:hypothetical protein
VGGPALFLGEGEPVETVAEVVGGLVGTTDVEPQAVRGVAVSAFPTAAARIWFDKI